MFPSVTKAKKEIKKIYKKYYLCLLVSQTARDTKTSISHEENNFNFIAIVQFKCNMWWIVLGQRVIEKTVHLIR